MSKRNVETASQYRSHSEKSQQTEAQQNVSNFNFELSVQQLMPLLSSIKQENDHISAQKRRMEQQMKLLHKMSKDILEQNQQLKKHYHERTNDLNKITKTMAINAKQQLTDLSHLCHIVKAHNSKIVKVIERKMVQRKNIDGSLENFHAELHHITANNINFEQRSRNKEIKVKQLENTYQDIQSRSSLQLQSKIAKLEGQVNQLIIQNNQYKQRNINMAKLLRIEVHTVQYQRPQIQQQSIEIIKNKQSLKQEIKQLQLDAQKFSNINAQLEKQKHNANEKLLKIERNTQRKRIVLVQNQRQVNLLKNRIQDAYKRLYEKQKNSAIKIDQKNDLASKIQKLKSEMKKKELKYKSTVQNLQKQRQEKITKLKSKIVALDLSYEQQIATKLNPEMGYAQQRVFQIKGEFNELIDQVQQLKQKIGKMDQKETFKEIVKIEYEIKQNESSGYSSYKGSASKSKRLFLH